MSILRSLCIDDGRGVLIFRSIVSTSRGADFVTIAIDPDRGTPNEIIFHLHLLGLDLRIAQDLLERGPVLVKKLGKLLRRVSSGF